MESEKQNSEWTFANYQRILSTYSSISLGLMFFFLGMIATGLGGLFAIQTADSDKISDKAHWTWGLAGLMIIMNLAIMIVWFRERYLRNQCVDALKGMGVPFPSSAWDGWTGWMWEFLYALSLVFWLCTFFINWR